MPNRKLSHLVFPALWTLAQLVPAFAEPLKVHPTNPRYFTDGTGRAIYLTGSHTWGNMFDFNPAISSAPPIDYLGYLDFLKRYNHNFARFWSAYGLETCVPCPYLRTGPGSALDGNPKLDLDQFNPEFFTWLRSRVVAARDRGIYAGITLFMPDGAKEADWPIQFLHPANNIQGIGNTSGARSYDLSDPRCTAVHEAFAREVIDHLNDLDNVLWEIGNEGDLTSIQCRAPDMGGGFTRVFR